MTFIIFRFDANPYLTNWLASKYLSIRTVHQKPSELLSRRSRDILNFFVAYIICHEGCPRSNVAHLHQKFTENVKCNTIYFDETTRLRIIKWKIHSRSTHGFCETKSNIGFSKSYWYPSIRARLKRDIRLLADNWNRMMVWLITM